MSPTQGKVSVRLSGAELNGIRDSVERVLGARQIEWIEIALFGSRTDLSKRGGDIDLYILIAPSPALDLFVLKRDLLVALKNSLGDQKIDLVLDDSKVDLGAFGDVIKKQKVELWIRS